MRNGATPMQSRFKVQPQIFLEFLKNFTFSNLYLWSTDMRTDFDFPQQQLLGPVVFRPDFNQFEGIGSNQAWSLFFTAGKEDKALGLNSEAGRFFTNLLLAIGVAGTLWATLFKNVV
jgi:hypothetical protein